MTDWMRLLDEPAGKRVHCVGIGGFGMAGLAALLQAQGFQVDGCDMAANRLTRRLESLGIPVSAGHSTDHLGPAPDLVVRSTAVSLDVPEIAAAIERGIPVCRRGELFPALLRKVPRLVAVSGTHGKTTTTAMCAHAIRGAGALPSFFIGGEWEADGRVFEAGTFPAMVVEADESDGTLIHYAPHIAVITGIDYDHMEHFADEPSFIAVFRRFIQQTKEALIYCGDDSRLAGLVRDAPCRVVSFGFSKHCNHRIVGVVQGAFGARFYIQHEQERLGPFQLPVAGQHNVLNAVAAMLVAQELGLSAEQAGASLQDFRLVRRRFDFQGTHSGIKVYADYAHHPTEIQALLETVRQAHAARVIAIFQPHRYTRTRALGSDFPPSFFGIDHVVLAPVYAASEPPLPGGTTADLARHFDAFGEVAYSVADSLEAAWELAVGQARAGDLLLLVGAGDIERLGGLVSEPGA